jgi:hypothetical protein
MGKAPNLKLKVKSLLHRQEALALVGQGWPITKISQKMGIAVQSVRRLLRQALATDSLFPSSLTPERVSELRVLEAEKIVASERKVIAAQNNAVSRLRDGNPVHKASAEATVIRAHEALVRSSERLARLFGLDQPVKAESLNWQVNMHQENKRIVISYDGGVVDELAKEEVPGLEIYDDENRPEQGKRLCDTAALSVASEVPGQG